MLFGLLFGTMCLFLLVTLVLRPRGWAHAHAHGGRCGPGGHGHARWRDHGHGPWRGHRHWRGGEGSDHGGPTRGGGSRRSQRREGFYDMAGRVVSEKLDLDEDQEEVVRDAVKDAAKAMRHLKDIVMDSRDELADAVKGETLDQPRLDAVFEKWDESVGEARRDVVEAVRKAHASLSARQRKELARWIETMTSDRW